MLFQAGLGRARMVKRKRKPTPPPKHEAGAKELAAERTRTRAEEKKVRDAAVLLLLARGHDKNGSFKSSYATDVHEPPFYGNSAEDVLKELPGHTYSRSWFTSQQAKYKEHIEAGGVAGTYQQPKQVGGPRAGAGPKKADKPPDYEVKRQRQRHVNDKAERDTLRDRERRWREYTTSPTQFRIPPAFVVMFGALDAVARDAFDDTKRTRAVQEDYIRLHSGICDVRTDQDKTGQATEGTGQDRRVLFPTPAQYKAERVAQKAGNSNIMLEATFWLSRLAHKQTILAFGVHLATSVREQWRMFMPGLSVAPGYPEGPLEMEFMHTPVGAPAQHRHQDTRHNVLTAFVTLGRHQSTSGDPTKSTLHSTYTATDIDRTDSNGVTKDLSYNQAHLNLNVEGYPVDVLLNHGTWPHGGPGNRQPNLGQRPRYILFYAFALDEIATKATTTTVYPSEYVKQHGHLKLDNRTPDKVLVQGAFGNWFEEIYKKKK
jgi:hypothetical protein